MQKTIRTSAWLCIAGAFAATICAATLSVIYSDSTSATATHFASPSKSNVSSIAANPIDTAAAETLLPDEVEVPQRFSAKSEAARLALPAAQDEQLADKMLVADLAVEVDYEGFVAFGGTQQAAENYVYRLMDTVNDIYQREANVRVRVSFVRIATTPNDPWTATTTHPALAELRKYWSANESTRQRAAVILLSGKKLGGGAAYIESACWYNYSAKDAFDFAVVGNMNGQFSTKRSDDNWDLVATAHELGHVFGSRHSHCTKRASQPGQWYDTCWSGESTCYSGTPSAMDGTLMSYCDKRGGMSKVMLSFSDSSGDPAIINNIRSFAQRMAETNTAEGGCLKLEDNPVATATPAVSSTPAATATPMPTATPTVAVPDNGEPRQNTNKIYLSLIMSRYKPR